MRTIKFRGKRVDNGEWVYGDLIRHYENQRRFIALDQMAYTYTENGISRLVSERYHEVLPESVGQFVNRTDKWGKEIYVGDTVEGYYIDQIYGCSVSKVLIKIEQYEDVVKLDELDSFAELMEVE